MTARALNRQWGYMLLTALMMSLLVPLGAWMFGVDYGYTLQTVTFGGALLGAMSGVVGTFAVLRQQSLMGDALSHAALPGVAIAFLLVGRDSLALLIGAGISGWLGALFVRTVTATTRIKQDTAMGIVLVSWFAFGIALMTYIQNRPDSSQAGLDSFIFGQSASIRQSDIQLMLLVSVGIMALLWVFWNPLKLLTFDAEFAHANGYSVRWLDTLLMSLIVVTIVLGLRLAGVVLMVGLLIAPSVAARQWIQTLGQMLFLSAVFGAFSGALGAMISAIDTDIPTGPVVIVVAFTLVMFSLLFSPQRGIVWSWRKRHTEGSR